MTSGTLENNASESIKEASKSVKFTDLLKMPSISISCFLLIISEMSVTWYLVSLFIFPKIDGDLGNNLQKYLFFLYLFIYIF